MPWFFCPHCNKRSPSRKGVAVHLSKSECYKKTLSQALLWNSTSPPTKCSDAATNGKENYLLGKENSDTNIRSEQGEDISATEEDVGYLSGDDPVCFIPDTAPFTFSTKTPMLDFARTKSMEAELDLLQLCCDINAPLYAFSRIMKWARQHHLAGYEFSPQLTTYQSQLSRLKRDLFLDNIHPCTQVVTLPAEKKLPELAVSVTSFQFVPMLYSLLSDPSINNSDCMFVDKANPFSFFTGHNDFLGEVHSGSWYRNAWKHMRTETHKNFMLGIILYIDKTVISMSGKLAAHPVTFSLTIFKEKTRIQGKAWRTLGYIPIEDAYQEDAEKKATDPDIKSKRYHILLRQVLASFIEAQQPNALNNITITIAGVKKTVSLYVPLAFIIGDVQGGNELTGHSGSNLRNCARLCRTCDVSFEDSSKTNMQCSRIFQQEVHELVLANAHQELKAMQQRPTYLVFFDIDCGNDPYGVFSMIHTESLHALEQGLFKYMLEMFCDGVPRKHRPDMDHGTGWLTQYLRQSVVSTYPRCKWKHGITRFANNQAIDRVGKLFLLTLFLLTDEGEDWFVRVSSVAEFEKKVYTFQLVLSYWAWLKQDHFWCYDNHNAYLDAKHKVDTMLHELKKHYPREDGNEWNITKFHEQRHIPDDIVRFGRHRNVHTGASEHNHIEHIKQPANKTQKRSISLDFQIGNRFAEHLIISRAQQLLKKNMWENISTNDYEEKTNREHNAYGHASKGTFYISINMSTDIDYEHIWRNKANNGLAWPFQNHVVAAIVDKLLPDDADALEVDTFTEITVDNQIYRCHPDYRNEGAWNDWAVVDDGSGIGKIVRILCFVKTKEQQPEEGYMVVHKESSTIPKEDDRILNILHHMEIHADGEPAVYVFPIMNTIKPVFIIPKSRDGSVVSSILPVSEWPALF